MISVAAVVMARAVGVVPVGWAEYWIGCRCATVNALADATVRRKEVTLSFIFFISVTAAETARQDQAEVRVWFGREASVRSAST